MIALADIIIGLFGIIAGFIAGRLSKRTQVTKVTSNSCTCGHPRGFHSDGTGYCRHDIPTNLFTLIAEGGRETCGCQIWDGPERPEDVIRGFQS
jgi:hypothetical protein